MSYYTYFTLKEDSRLKDKEPQEHSADKDKYKTLLMAEMIQAYYEPKTVRKYGAISLALKMYVWDIIQLEKTDESMD